MKKLLTKMKGFFGGHYVAFVVCLAVFLTIAVEALGRRSLFDGLGFMISDPLMFCCNAIIIFITLSVCFFCKRRIFSLTSVSLLWLVCGIVNFTLLGFRTTPFSAVDLQILGSVLGIIDAYMKVWQIILAAAALVIAAAGLVALWLKAPKLSGKIPYRKSLTIIAVTAVSALLLNSTATAEEGPQDVQNIADAYEEYGFAYCFSTSILDQGIDRPEDYSPVHMDMLRKEIENRSDGSSAGNIPNIIMVQLESFISADNLSGISFNENPTPYFTYLKKSFGSGFLTVPTVGAGTANTEFETLTGISLDYFGASEYPYKTELIDKTLESICFDLKKYGFSSHAIHNNSGTFYDRHRVFPNLGFDSFTPVEYMNDVSFNSLGWADDEVLIDKITDSITLSDSKDFVYAITVESHGKYPREDLNSDIKVVSSEKEMPDGLKYAYEYYADQLRAADDFVHDLTDCFAFFEEPVVIVFFGDHLPNLELEPEDLLSGDLFKTDYVVWSNFKLPDVKKDLSAYRLSAHIFDLLGLDGGYINDYNRYFSEDENYPDGLRYLGYDALYGYGAEKAYVPAEMEMGMRPVIISSVSEIVGADDGEEPRLIVKGEGFTPYSSVSSDGNKMQTEFIDENTLIVYDAGPLEDIGAIYVEQTGSDLEVLSVSDSFDIT